MRTPGTSGLNSPPRGRAVPSLLAAPGDYSFAQGSVVALALARRSGDNAFVDASRLIETTTRRRRPRRALSPERVERGSTLCDEHRVAGYPGRYVARNFDRARYSLFWIARRTTVDNCSSRSNRGIDALCVARRRLQFSTACGLLTMFAAACGGSVPSPLGRAACALGDGSLPERVVAGRTCLPASSALASYQHEGRFVRMRSEPEDRRGRVRPADTRSGSEPSPERTARAAERRRHAPAGRQSATW